jgi:aspartate/tyrosine/aromatic aminotransferase
MRERIQAMRRVLHDTLKKKMPARDFGYFLTQRGMFSYTGSARRRSTGCARNSRSTWCARGDSASPA